MPVEQFHHTVFISYAREDFSWVNAAVNLLIAGGAKVFMDVRDIAYGEKWEDVLRLKLHEVERVMVFWSKHAAESSWVKEEWEVAVQIGKRLVPVPIDDTPLPAGLSQFQALTDLKPLLQPGLDNDEEPLQYGKSSSRVWINIIAATAGLLLLLSPLLLPFVIDRNSAPPFPPNLSPLNSLDSSALWFAVLGILSALALLTWVVIRWIQKRREARRLRHAFGQYLSPNLIEEIRKAQHHADVDVGKRVVSMVFEDSTRR